MSQIIVAFDSGSNRRRISDMLDSVGMTVKGVCRSGAEAIRKVQELNGGLVICGYKLADMTAADLARGLDGKACILVIAPPDQLGDCGEESVFTLPAPVTKADVVSSVRMLEQLLDMLSRRSAPERGTERQVIDRAAALLCRKSGMPEADARRFIQRRSVESGLKLTDAARRILRENAAS